MIGPASSIPLSCGRRCGRKTSVLLASQSRNATTRIHRIGRPNKPAEFSSSVSVSATVQSQQQQQQWRSFQSILPLHLKGNHNLMVFRRQAFASMATQSLPSSTTTKSKRSLSNGTRKRRRRRPPPLPTVTLPMAANANAEEHFWQHQRFATVSSTAGTNSSIGSYGDGGDGDDDGDENDDEHDFRPPRWLQKTKKRAEANKPIDSQKAYRYLRLEKFTEDELKERFQTILEASNGNNVVSEQSDDETNTNTNTNTMDQEQLLSYLKETIRTEEQERDEVLSNRNRNRNPEITTSTTTKSYIDRLRTEYIAAESKQLWKFLRNPSESNNSNAFVITESEFVERLIDSATSLDKQRLWPLTLSMVMIGLSVGVTTPAFPFVVQNLGLTTGEYGMVVSAFALTKLLGNIPFAVLVERNGRKPYLVYSLIAISTGVGCIGLASGFEELYACRLVTGLGVAGLSCAATMAVTDISTPLNRASSFAPISAGFAAGTAMGPALGGILIDELGVNPTFYLVGGSFLMLGGINSVLLDETMKKPHTGFPWQQTKSLPRKHTADLSSSSNTEQHNNAIIEHDNASSSSSKQHNIDDEPDPDSIQHAFKSALGQWAPLLSEAPIRNVCIINGFYWVALAGGQMTLLPLLLTDPTGLAMTATQVGQVYMGMSCVQVLGNPLFARVVDNVGTVPGIVGGCTMISAAMYALPAVAMEPCDYLQFAGVLGLWAAGSSLLSTSPIAHIGNTVDDSKRAQAIALLRTAGDVGFLVGASSMGMVSDWAGSLETAMQSSAAILGTATSWYVARNYYVLTSSKLLRKD